MSSSSLRLLGALLLAGAAAVPAAPAAASPGLHTVTADCSYDGTQVVGVAVAGGSHTDSPVLTLRCHIGAGPAGTTYGTTVRGNVVTLTAAVTGYPPTACAEADAAWDDSHLASYTEPCPQ